jgi:hypothetical protein
VVRGLPETRCLGHGYATEASRTLTKWAFKGGAIDELFAVTRPHNKRAIATATRLGMEWVGETDKHYDLKLRAYRLRASDFRPDSSPRNRSRRVIGGRLAPALPKVVGVRWDPEFSPGFEELSGMRSTLDKLLVVTVVG